MQYFPNHKRVRWVPLAYALEGATKTEYKFGSFERLLCPDNSDSNFIAGFKLANEMLKKTCEAVVTP